MRPRKPWLVALAATLLLLVLGAAALWLWLTSSGRPLRDGEVRLGGAVLGAPVEVRFDRWGVPHVAAGSLADLVAAQGFLHANDRFTQMEFGRRAAAGRLSEIFGERTVEVDRELRTLRFREAAEGLLAAAGPESRRILDSYAAGVNAWLASRGGDLPPELELLRLAPEPWTPVDSLGFVLLMADDLSFWSGRPEEVRLGWLVPLGPERVRDLLGEPGLEIPPELLATAAGIDPAPPPASPAPPPPDGATGSNNWVLGPERTASGAPLLANDPHLPLRVPSTWYQMLLRAPGAGGYEASGMTLPGVPGVVIGRGPRLAWALTNTMLDDHDLFLERLRETDAGPEVLRAGGWVPVEEVTETIRVRGGEPVEVTLRRTDLGPLLPADPERGLPPRSLAWTLYAPGDPLSAFLALARAGSVAAAFAGLDGYVGPAQNLVAADEAGGYGFTVLGRIPARRGAADGRLPGLGWEPGAGWEGLLPREANPTLLDPSPGLLVTANHDIRPPGYAGPLTADFDTPHRAHRIAEILTSRPRWSASELPPVQTDLVSLWARELVAHLEAPLAAGAFEGDAAAAAELLVGWGGGTRGTMSGGAAWLFELFDRELGAAIFGDEAKAAGVAPFASRERVRRLLDGGMSPRWLDDLGTRRVEDHDEILARALAAAWRRAREAGGEPEAWSWEARHELALVHPLASLPVLGGWFGIGTYGVPGSATTVAAFGGAWRGDGQRVVYGPSMRWVADLADPDAGLAVLPGGQSGHPGDPHYDDQVPLYLAGEMRPVAWSDEAIEAATRSRLRLVGDGNDAD